MFEIGDSGFCAGSPARIFAKIPLKREQDTAKQFFWHTLCSFLHKNFAAADAPFLRGRLQA
jgi:hypothetical protein